MKEIQEERLYRLRFGQDMEDARFRLWQALCSDFFQRWIPVDGSVLDIGAGDGAFLTAIAAHRKIGCDMRLRPERLAASIEWIQGPWEGLDRLLDAAAVDVVFLSNFLEHLSSKAAVHRLLALAWRLLRPSGRLLILGPNIDFTGTRYWDFIDHQLPLNHRSVGEALGCAGFAIESCVPRFLPYTTKSRLPQRPLLVRCYLRFPVLWRLLGAQMFIVGRKEVAR